MGKHNLTTYNKNTFMGEPSEHGLACLKTGDTDVFHVRSEPGYKNIYWVAQDDSSNPTVGSNNAFRPCVAYFLEGDEYVPFYESNGEPLRRAWLIEKQAPITAQPVTVQMNAHYRTPPRAVSARHPAPTQLAVLAKLANTDQSQVHITEDGRACVRTVIHPGKSVGDYVSSRCAEPEANFLGSMDLENVWKNVSTLFESCLQGALDVHQTGYLHLDATVNNVVINFEGDYSCRWIDFETAIKKENAWTVKGGIPRGTPSHMPPELRENGRVVKLSESIDYYHIACVLGCILINEFTEGKIEAVDSVEHQAMLAAMVTTLLEQIVLPMYAADPSERQSIEQSLKRLKKLDEEFSAWFGACKQRGMSTVVTVSDNRNKPVRKTVIPGAKEFDNALNKLKSYRNWGKIKLWLLCFSIFGLFFISSAKRRYMDDANAMIKKYERSNDADKLLQLLVSWHILLARDVRWIKHSAFYKAYEAVLADSTFSQVDIDQAARDKEAVKSECLAKVGTFAKSCAPGEREDTFHINRYRAPSAA